MQDGLYDKALKFYEPALARRKKSLRVDHPDTVGSMALVFNRQGQYVLILATPQPPLGSNSACMPHDKTSTSVSASRIESSVDGADNGFG